MKQFDFPVSHHKNSNVLERETLYPLEYQDILSLKGFERANETIKQWPDYQPTPLYSLSTLAERLAVKNIWYKDEAFRFTLESFKALGGAYAVYELLAGMIKKQTGHGDISVEKLLQGEYQAIANNVTVCCATDGNHGRSVAWGAQMFGCRSVIYLHEHVSQGREQAIASYGAEIKRVKGNYDDSIRIAAEDANKNDWTVISDTSYPGYMDIPRFVMQGYSVMVDEALKQMEGAIPSHVFIQGGVGGLAAAVTAHLWEKLGEKRPNIIIVEPTNAGCLFKSAKAGSPQTVSGNLDTIMAGLACGEVSLLAWDILRDGVHDFLMLSDDAIVETMKLCVSGEWGGSPFISGESGAAGLAGLLAIAKTSLAENLGISSHSEILLFGTEGATDKEVFAELVGTKVNI